MKLQFWMCARERAGSVRRCVLASDRALQPHHFDAGELKNSLDFVPGPDHCLFRDCRTVVDVDVYLQIRFPGPSIQVAQSQRRPKPTSPYFVKIISPPSEAIMRQAKPFLRCSDPDIRLTSG